MKMEDHFKETLNRAVANEPPVQDSWSTFERRVRRGRSLRLVTAFAAAAAIVAAGVIVGPKVLRDDTGIGVATNPPSPTPNNYEDWNYSRNTTELWQVSYPKDWYGQMATLPSFEGVTELQPPGVEPLEKGLPTFAVTIRFDQGGDPVDPLPGEPTEGREPLPADYSQAGFRTESLTSDGQHMVIYQYAWVGCAAGEQGCREVPGQLIVRVMASTKDLRTQYGAIGERIARSLDPITNGPAPIKTPRGQVTTIP